MVDSTTAVLTAVPEIPEDGARRALPPHYSLKAGDVDPELGKTILEIVLCTELFIVYVDEDMAVQWHTTDDHERPDYCGEVLNMVASLEAQSRFLTGEPMLRDIRRRIGEGLVRCLEGGRKEDATAVLKEVGAELKTRNKEVSWHWYFQASYYVTLGFAILFAAAWLLRDWIRAGIGTEAFEVILGGSCGSFGALLFATARSDRLILDANAGRRLHRLEGLSRIGAGVIGALVVALAIKAGLILGGTTFPGNKLALLLCFCLVAGASERLVPSLIATFEKTVSGGARENNPASGRRR
ncbi:hypothetical protein ACQCP0_19080 [Ralstonia pseudosolanacearum]|uniref:hypothetical protein n=2 Tax=Ralstonia pseudosolanacearum TaxID=1310165 RepID=UPI0022030540|nr:hypothetical protein NHF34_01045 [Ralstonia solanacearum]